MCHRGGEKKLSDGLSGKQCLSCSRHTDLEDEDGYDDEEDHDEEDDGDGHPDYLASVELPGAGEVTDVEGEVCLHPPCAVLRYTFVPPTLTLWKSETFYIIICIYTGKILFSVKFVSKLPCTLHLFVHFCRTF